MKEIRWWKLLVDESDRLRIWSKIVNLVVNFELQ